MTDLSKIVKPLEWNNFDAWNWWAESNAGTYNVTERNGVWKTELCYGGMRHVVYEIDDYETAVEAANLDNARRILSAIDLDALIRAGIEEGLRMGADKAEHRWREWGNLAPHEKVECDVTACEDIAMSILSTSPEVISAAVARVKGGE